MSGEKVLVLHTGGTIGMVEREGELVPEPHALARELRRRPPLCDPELEEFTTAPYEDGSRVRYDLLELDPLLDSANVDLGDWTRFADVIGSHYEDYAGFVVLHGTDTMAYTASALSFMLEGLGKPVVLTGAQIPLVRVRSDGYENLLTALWVAARSSVPEVMLAFHHRVYRGNRASKRDATGIDAFDSPNFPPLARAGVDIVVDRALLLPQPSVPFAVRSRLCPNVAALRLFPGITDEIVANFLREPLAGLVLETYGAGNAPDVREPFLRAIADASARGVVIVNVTQCWRGAVRASYRTGRRLLDAGVVPGADLVPEAALAKLCWLLGNDSDRDRVRLRMAEALRGELTD
jgi:L-asparaginase type I